MAKRGPMDIYMKQRQSVSNESDAGSTEVLTEKEVVQHLFENMIHRI